MPEPLYEAERAAWIKGRRWWDRHAAMRRADLLARASRKRERAATGVGDSALHEEITKGRFAQWTHHDDTKTSALGAITYVMLFCYALPLVVGVAWVVRHVSYLLWLSLLRPYASRPWPPLLVAAVVAVAAVMVRRLGLDLPVIYALAAVYEQASGGVLAPAALSRWYAAGTVSWLEAQLILGLLWSVYRAWAWGWVAPTVLRATATAAASARDGDPGDATVRILGGPAATVPVAVVDDDVDPALKDPGFQIIPDPLSKPEEDAPDAEASDVDDIDLDLDDVMQIIPTVTTIEKEPS